MHYAISDRSNPGAGTPAPRIGLFKPRERALPVMDGAGQPGIGCLRRQTDEASSALKLTGVAHL
jgi:hypothetical protein